MDKSTGEILHIFVIGFHHKKGCQIEFSYPEVKSLPEEWRNLPSLAMPDGAHNYENDAVYFHLPSLNGNDQTIFGISCFQQIPLEKVKKKTEDMTRGTIQKAICILSTLPLFGYIQIKMELVTAAFFDEGDFSNVSLLKDAFHHLNDCLTNSYSQHLLDGLSVRDLILRFRHRILILFKLMLLERKVIFFNSPVKPLCCTLLSLISLHPGLIEKGLLQSFPKRKCSKSASVISEHVLDDQEETGIKYGITNSHLNCKKAHVHEGDTQVDTVEEAVSNYVMDLCYKEEKTDLTAINDVKETRKDLSRDDCIGDFLVENYYSDIKEIANEDLVCSTIASDLNLFPSRTEDINFFRNLDLDSFGLPLNIFIEGNLCLPYISISYLDFLTSPEVRGFHGGAANLLFKQKKQIMDVLVELDGPKIETNCAELRRQLFLTTEDLRFGERLVRGITDPNSFAQDSPGNNCEEWIRMQFTMYMLSLLRTSLLPDGSKELEHFNVNFINAWKNTVNYKLWMGRDHKGIMELSPGHPYAGNLSVSDMRLRFSQAMTNTESGRRINQAVTSTGRAVGGAFIQARGALSNWWSNLTTPEAKPERSINNI